MKRVALMMGVVLSTLTAQDAAAQWNVARFGGEQQNRTFVTVGIDPAVTTTIGYARVVEVLGHGIQLSGEAGVVAAGEMDANDFRARLGMQTSLVHKGALHVTGSATFVTRGTENVIYRGLNFGADVSGTVGLYRNRWFAAGEFGFDKAIVTHVRHTDYYRENYFADAKDGWYLDNGGTYHYGLVGGVAFGRVELVARAERLRTQKFNDLMLPMAVSLGVGWAF